MNLNGLNKNSLNSTINFPEEYRSRIIKSISQKALKPLIQYKNAFFLRGRLCICSGKSYIYPVNHVPVWRMKVITTKVAFLTHQTTEDSSKLLDDFSQETTIPKEQLYEILGVYISILRLLLNSTDAEFTEKLTEIGFPSSFLETLPIVFNREVVNKLSNYNNYKHISTIKWKIDISLSNSTIVKKAPTPVILCIEMKNGEKYTIEIDVKVFHKLRLNVALILKEMIDIK